ncbi:MAG TPA: cell envelope integrity TolA C-terminal domain-containing protein [Gammaproteobacteria bacterium]|nr:cell envelope integrity TolA C-terminal domain-containing protein [Gammaproteobacteria bacterium]
MQRTPVGENYSAAVFWSIVLHAGIVVLLVLRFHWNAPQLPSAGEVIEAEVVDSRMLEAVERQKRQQTEQAQAEQRRREAERQAAEQQKLRAEQERKLALQKKQEAEKKAAEEKRQKEEAARKAEQKRKQDEARKAEVQQQLADAQKREQEQLQADAARAQAEQKELASARELYMLAILQAVKRRWIKVPSAVTGQTCEAVIRQIPGGEVISVEMGTCQGDAALQRSVEQAIYMASPLPTPADPRVFDRALHITFEVD